MEFVVNGYYFYRVAFLHVEHFVYIQR